MAFTGADIGAFAAAAGSSRDKPSVSLTTTAAGSFVIGVGIDPERRGAKTPDPGQIIYHQWVDMNQNATFWVQVRTAQTPAGGIATISDLGTNSRWNLAAVEVVPR